MKEAFSHDSGRQLLDLLVDGELDELQRHELLRRLEDEPDGWRRCALAFLEAQSWHRELRVILPQEPATRSAAPLAAVRPRRSRLASMLAAAAGLLLAFVSGMAASDRMRPAEAPVARSANSQPSEAEPHTGERSADPDEQTAEPDWPLAYINLRVVAGAGRQDRIVRVPVVQGSESAEDWLLNQPPPVPLELARALEKLGHRILQHRELIPLELSDGQHAILPVDRVEIHTAARPAYY